ncbi:pyridoxine 5'-phosphate synthase [Candidatus Mesenet endosymbiont of Agriotes lineatus]|uniref:pyridoxine 5'-phosphate synthase n=1 Tax=Candidatus Mesenet endosymbiont of Agriotes lineatus TaxID=3077948 RepID=UPI0030CC963A
MLLGVNIDHVATLRNARGTSYPNPLDIALAAISAGADFITVHLREDRRHIKDQDVRNLKNNIGETKLNLEIAPTHEMLTIAKQIKPYSICIVPENRKEITTERGLYLINENLRRELTILIKEAHKLDIKVSLFVEPNVEQLKYVKELQADVVELHTGNYCNNPSAKEFKLITTTAKYLVEHKIECHAGHGLTYESAAVIAKIPHISALNIGHFLICNALFNGIEHSIKKMKAILTKN